MNNPFSHLMYQARQGTLPVQVYERNLMFQKYRNKMKLLYSHLEKRRSLVSEILNSKDTNEIINLVNEIKFKDSQIKHLQYQIYNIRN
jgi:hypothetical protein